VLKVLRDLREMWVFKVFRDYPENLLGKELKVQ